MIAVTVSADKNISLKEFQELSKYKDLKIKVTKMWKLKTKTIPVVVGALGMIKKGTQNFMDQILGKPSLQEMQKVVLTSTYHISRKVLSMWLNTLLSLINISKYFSPQLVRHATFHLPEVSDKRLGRWLYQTSI